MSLKNTIQSYGSLAKIFHWSTALLVIGLLTVGLIMEDFPNEAIQGQMYFLHKSTGLLVLALMVLRIVWVLANAKPQLPSMTPRWEKIATHMTHGLLYLALLLMPLSGWLMSSAANKTPSFYGLFSVPMPGIPVDKALAKLANGAHSYIAWFIIGVLILHIAAALKHHFINRDNILTRMLPGKSD